MIRCRSLAQARRLRAVVHQQDITGRHPDRAGASAAGQTANNTWTGVVAWPQTRVGASINGMLRALRLVSINEGRRGLREAGRAPESASRAARHSSRPSSHGAAALLSESHVARRPDKKMSCGHPGPLLLSSAGNNRAAREHPRQGPCCQHAGRSCGTRPAHTRRLRWVDIDFWPRRACCGMPPEPGRQECPAVHAPGILVGVDACDAIRQPCRAASAGPFLPSAHCTGMPLRQACPSSLRTGWHVCVGGMPRPRHRRGGRAGRWRRTS